VDTAPPLSMGRLSMPVSSWPGALPAIPAGVGGATAGGWAGTEEPATGGRVYHPPR
jgi:hypothetical protein